MLGELYRKGIGVKKAYKKSMQWYHKAYKNGYTKGAKGIGILYNNGLGVQKDLDKAISWYKKATD
jgi:TPR repeat protein